MEGREHPRGHGGDTKPPEESSGETRQCPGHQWQRVRRLLLALTSFLFHTRVLLLVGKCLGFGGIARWKEQEGFRGKWTINPCAMTQSP